MGQGHPLGLLLYLIPQDAFHDGLLPMFHPTNLVLQDRISFLNAERYFDDSLFMSLELITLDFNTDILKRE